MRFMITGSSGMIGSLLVERLLDAGHDVIPVDRRPNIWNDRIDAVTVHTDLLDADAVRSLPVRIDWVVHLAANARVHDLVVDPTGARENMVTAFNAFEQARRAGAFCVFASSREVYGNQRRGRYGETDVDLEYIESPYAASKLAGEVLLRSYGRAYGMSHAIVRFSNVYGRNDTSNRFVPVVFRSLLEGRPITIYGREKSLDFTYIEDTLNGLQLIFDSPSIADGRVFNLSRGERFGLIKAAEMIAEIVGYPLDLRIEDTRPGEVTQYEGDISLARDLLGYNPQVDLWEGLRRSAIWYQRHSAQRVRPGWQDGEEVTRSMVPG